MHELRGLRGGARCEVVALDEGGAEASRCRVEGDARAGDAATDDEDIEALIGQSPKVGGSIEPVSHAGGHATSGLTRERSGGNL